MQRVKFNTNKSVDAVCKEIEQMISDVLETHHNKTKKDKAIVYYPARRYMGTDDAMDDITITVRKVNNSTTNICLENSEYTFKPIMFGGIVAYPAGCNWRCPALTLAYTTLYKVLNQMYG